MNTYVQFSIPCGAPDPTTEKVPPPLGDFTAMLPQPVLNTVTSSGDKRWGFDT